MTKYTQHNLKDKDGRKLSALEASELRGKAKVMYLREKLSLVRIAAISHVSTQTVSNWKKKDGWDLVAKQAEKAKEKILLKDLTGQVQVGQLVDKEYVIEGLRKIAEDGITESNRVAAFKALGDSLGMFDKKGVTPDQEAPLIIEAPTPLAVPAEAKEQGSAEVDKQATAPVASPEPGVAEPPFITDGNDGANKISTPQIPMGSS